METVSVQEGFSIKRIILFVLLSTRTVPNSCGFFVLVRRIVACLFFCLWFSICFFKSNSHTASPEMISTGSSNNSASALTAPALPFGSLSLKKDRFIRLCFIASICSGRYIVVTAAQLKPFSASKSRILSNTLRLKTGSSGFGLLFVIGASLLPKPPAIITALKRALLSFVMSKTPFLCFYIYFSQ